MIYSEKVMEHFENPRNVGVIENPDGIGEIGNPVCGDMMTFYIKVNENRIDDVKFKTFGCGAAIAVSSIVSEMAIGKTIEDALKISNKDVAKELGGLPKNKMHCSNLGADALHKAIQNYLDKEKTPEKAAAEPSAKKKDEISCPFCEGPMEGLESFCKQCHTELKECPECGDPVTTKNETCPHCKAPLKNK